MKAKTIVGMMACAAFASAFADIDNNKATTNDWFSASVSGESVSVTGAAWDTTPAVEGSTTKVMVIDADVTSPATLTPTKDGNNNTAADLASDGLVTIASSAYLAPSATNDLPAASALGNAQVGFAVAVDGDNATNYYGYVRTAANAGTWFKLTGVQPPDGENDTTFTIVLDYRSTVNKVSFVVGSTMLADGNSATAFTFVPVSAKLSDVAAIGSGTITSINAKYEKAVAVGKDNKPYGTIAEAYNTTGGGSVVAWDSTTGAAATGDDVYALNGLTKAVCMALNMPTDDATAKIALRPADAAKKVADKITLATAVNPVDNVNVKFAVATVSGTPAGQETYPADAIELPLGTGTYTVTPTVSGK